MDSGAQPDAPGPQDRPRVIRTQISAIAWRPFEMNPKIVALIVLVVALFGLVYSIEVTARPPSQRIGTPQVDTGGEGD
jgi:hypothetical protein